MKRYADSTLKGMTKDELIRYVRTCENNQEVAEEELAHQYENFKTIVKDWEIKKHGKWINGFDEDKFKKHCSCCGGENENGFSTNYCPHCGAKMDKED